MIRKNAKPLMIAVGGMSGSGKTTLAFSLAEKLPGAILLDSDVVRKRMEGVSPDTPLGPEYYTPEKTRKFIKYIQREAAGLLKKGHSVVVTGTFLGNDERKNQQLVAQKSNADFIGIYLDAPLSVLFDRVANRTASASDADQEVVRRQVRKSITGQQGLHWYIVNAAQPQADVQRDAIRLVARELHRYRILASQSVQSPKPPGG
jgi:predicted kinase